ncbi:LacI family gluconate utilization system Gnt-I transcriptional repressor [Brooklawnia cerclae]|uniref:LacI family gluconate utilization system Gnt-I transcriptional repressor n=2 Tax=Brooklawnia cerclae TaxID=349934 RepID=A0ABX0SIW2_9ACTN|nr:LacI family gluconate utilization system Gnt-I transcriptional repressor [Brooklawnia cerclae]
MTMLDVAEAAGVSAQTVSRALNRPQEVSEETRRRVELAVKSTGYLGNLAASHLASNRSRTIAAILPVISTSVFSDTLGAAASLLTPAGYQLIVGFTNYEELREEALVRSFIQRRPDGFIIIGTVHTSETVRLLRAYGAPVVETWDWNDDPVDALAGFSNQEAMRELVHRLHDTGYHAITFACTISAGDHRAIRRLDGFKQAMREISPDDPPRLVELQNRAIAMSTGTEMLGIALERYPDTDLLVFASDVFASAALLEAQRQGIRVPDDLAIAGFGDFELARHLNPPLTTVSVDGMAIGRQATDLLLKRLRGETSDHAMVDVGYQIVRRGSA